MNKKSQAQKSVLVLVGILVFGLFLFLSASQVDPVDAGGLI